MPKLESYGKRESWGKYTSTRTNACIVTPVTGKTVVVDKFRYQNYSGSNNSTVKLAGYTTSTGITSTQWIGAPRIFTPYGSETLIDNRAYRLTQSYGLFFSHSAASSCGYEVAYHLE